MQFAFFLLNSYQYKVDFLIQKGQIYTRKDEILMG